jgi:hypothetical protein
MNSSAPRPKARRVFIPTIVLTCVSIVSAVSGQDSPASPPADRSDGERVTVGSAPGDPDSGGTQNGGIHLELDFRYLYGAVKGSVQTPSGGEPGTTSPNRPSLGEIGIDDASIFDGSLLVQLDRHMFSLGGQIIRLDGNATLERDLLSHSLLFPAGTDVHSSVQLDWYRFGYRYEFRFDLHDSGSQLRLAPGIEGVLLNFDYSLDVPGGAGTSRGYAKGGLRIGGTAEWITASPFSIEATGYWGLPIDNTAQILSVELLGKYQLWGNQRGTGGAAYLGIAYEQIEYEDNQEVPNHVDVQLGPLLVAGIEVRF